MLMIYWVQIGQDRQEMYVQTDYSLPPTTAGRAQPARVFQLLPATMKSKVVGALKKVFMIIRAVMMMMVQAM